MLTEGFVSMMALIAATILVPGRLFRDQHEVDR